MAEIKQGILLEKEILANTEQTQNKEQSQTIQLVQPKEAKDEIAKLERQYREIVEKMNK